MYKKKKKRKTENLQIYLRKHKPIILWLAYTRDNKINGPPNLDFATGILNCQKRILNIETLSLIPFFKMSSAIIFRQVMLFG